MNFTTILEFIGAWLTAAIPVGILLAGISAFVGKLLFQKIVADDQRRIDDALARLENELDFVKEVRLDVRSSKLRLYQEILDLVATLLGSLDAYLLGGISKEEARKRLYEFNEGRLRIYGRLALFAPQNVMDCSDQLVDHLLLVARDKKSYDWKEIRSLALNLINSMRQDIDSKMGSISYNGEL